ncbi:MAG: DUF4185 domain-containing protein [Bacteroidetes bacterium]|nr:DUF4185 domain-containing protein [Bacteroidota bacterium]
MKPSSIFFPCLVIGLLLAAVSCKKENKGTDTTTGPVIIDTIPAELTNLKYTVESAPAWTQLFLRNSGWVGGDGIFSIPLNGVDSIGGSKTDKTLLLFSDTQIGEIQNGVLLPGWSIINNSVAVINGNEPLPDKISFYWNKDANNKPLSVFIPASPLAMQGDYFWLGDGFVNQALQNDIFIMSYKIRKVNTSFGFAVGGSSIITIPSGSNPPFKNAIQTDAPLFVEGDKIDNGYAFGAGIFVNTAKAGAPHPDGYIYVYGVKNLPELLNKGLMVGRVKPEDFKDFSKWRFWDGKEWSININNIKNAAVITDRVSDELSITPLSDGRYVLIFQADVWGSVAARLSTTPIGPFGPVIKLWDCKEALTGKDYFAYNAKAHPNLSKPGELLISFNLNSFNFFKDILSDPNLYRPRFIKLKFL